MLSLSHSIILHHRSKTKSGGISHVTMCPNSSILAGITTNGHHSFLLLLSVPLSDQLLSCWALKNKITCVEKKTSTNSLLSRPPPPPPLSKTNKKIIKRSSQLKYMQTKGLSSQMMSRALQIDLWYWNSPLYKFISSVENAMLAVGLCHSEFNIEQRSVTRGHPSGLSIA